MRSFIDPPPRLKISEWAEREAYLPQEGNAEPGKFRIARMPWQKDMLDDPLDNTVQEYAWMLASQLGKTMCICLIVEYFVACIPTKILVVYPKLQDATDWMRDKFIPATRDTPALEGKLKEPRERDSESRALNRKFPGGGLVAVGSISTSSLRRVSARVVIQDEIDDFEITPQGDSMALADKRATTFHNAVLLKSSTPTHKGTSRIEKKWEASDKQRFFVPCQKCGHMQYLRWEQIKFTFERGPGVLVRDTENTVYECESCKSYWNDQQRMTSIFDPRSKWIATAPASKIRGRHLNGLYQVIGKKNAFKSYLHQFAEDFLEAKKGGRSTFMVWINTFLAETFADPTKEIDWNPLSKRGEDYGPELPDEVTLLLAGLDVQGDRVEIKVSGWGDEEEMWWIANKIVYGDFDLPHVQQQVDDYLLSTFKHPSGATLRITAACIDSAHKTKAVYKFCKSRASRMIWAVKGSSTPQAPLVTPNVKRIYGITLFSVGTDTAKDAIFDRLGIQEPGPRYIHFPKAIVNGKPTGFDDKYFKQLCSEKLVERFENGVFTRKYEKVQARNEALDIFVYTLACYDIVRPNMARLRMNTIPSREPSPRREYVLKPVEEVKKAEPEIVKLKEKPKSVVKRFGGGLFNPLGI